MTPPTAPTPSVAEQLLGRADYLRKLAKFSAPVMRAEYEQTARLLEHAAVELSALKREGWVMAPREPTEAMIAAGRMAFGDAAIVDRFAEMFKAMLAAAPEEGK